MKLLTSVFVLLFLLGAVVSQSYAQGDEEKSNIGVVFIKSDAIICTEANPCKKQYGDSVVAGGTSVRTLTIMTYNKEELGTDVIWAMAIQLSAAAQDRIIAAANEVKADEEESLKAYLRVSDIMTLDSVGHDESRMTPNPRWVAAPVEIRIISQPKASKDRITWLCPRCTFSP